MSLELVAGLCLGSSLGLVSGMIISRHIGMTPHAKELSKALDENESYYRQMVARLKGRMKEYEHPSDLQRLAQSANGAQGEDQISMMLNNLGSIKGIPGWIRPFIPGVVAYAKEHPAEVTSLIQKFLKQGGKGSGEDLEGDTL